MKRLQQFVNRYRAAAAIIVVAVAAFAGWKLYNVLTAGGPAPAAQAVAPAARPTPSPSGGSAGAPAAGPAGSAALRAAGHLTGVPAPTLPGASPSTSAAAAGGAASAGQPRATAAPQAAATSTPPPPATGRADPFSPLVGGGGPSTVPPLPPVPPLAPGALGTSASTLPGPVPGAVQAPGGELQLTGIVFGPSAVAILNDGGGSYIVEPGDTVKAGVRIVSIDAENRTVTLESQDQSWQLRLGGGTSR